MTIDALIQKAISGQKGTSTRDLLKDREAHETTLYNAKKTLPSMGETVADAMKDISGSLGPKNAFQPLVGGVSAGAKIASLSDRKDDLAKYEKVMNYFGAMNQTLLERSQYEDKLTDAKKRLLPQISAYGANAASLDATERDLMARQMLDDWNRMTDGNVHFLSLSATNPFLATVAKDGQTQTLDMRSLFAPDDVAQADFALTMPQIQAKMAEERKHRAAQEAHWKASNTLGWANHNQRTDLHDPDNVRNKAQAKQDPTHFNKYYDDLLKEVSHADMFKSDLEQMLHMLDTDQVITSDNLGSDIKQWLANTFGGDQKGKQQTFEQLSAAFLPKLKQLFGSRITDVDLHMGEAKLFASQGKHKEANRMLIQNALQTIDHILEEERLVHDLLEQHNYEVPMGAVYQIQNQLRKQRRGGDKSGSNSTGGQPPSPSNNMARVRGPDGAIKLVPSEQAEQLLTDERFTRV